MGGSDQYMFRQVALRDRRLIHLAACAAATVAHTWPLASAPATWSRMDNADTALNAWALAWVAHVLPRAPLELFNANIFFPEPRTLAFSEHMVVQGVLGLPFFAGGLSAAVVYNILLMVGFTWSAYAMTRVVTRWSGDNAAGLMAGLAYAFNAHSLVRLTHMQALHVQFLPLALAALHDLRETPRRRNAALLACWCTLQALTSNYLLVMTAIAILAAVVALPECWRRPDGRQRLVLLCVAAVLSSLALAPFLWPYAVARSAQGLVRSVDEVASYAAQSSDYLSTAARLHYATWSYRFSLNTTPLFPGITVLVFATLAVLRTPGLRHPVVRSLVAVALAGIVVSFGMRLPGYRWLYDHIPLLQGIRATVRIGWLALFALSALAGLGMAGLSKTMAARHRHALAAVAIALVTAESLRAPIGYVPLEPIPGIYAHVATLPQSAVLVEVPVPPRAMFHLNGPYMLASTTHFRRLVNGYSGFRPASYVRNAELARSLPEPNAIDGLRRLGVTHIVVHGRPELAQRLKASGEAFLLAEVDNDRLFALFR